MTPSPVNWLTVPSKRWMAPATIWKKAIEHAVPLFGVDVLGERHRMDDVGEEDGDELSLAGERATARQDLRGQVARGGQRRRRVRRPWPERRAAAVAETIGRAGCRPRQRGQARRVASAAPALAAEAGALAVLVPAARGMRPRSFALPHSGAAACATAYRGATPIRKTPMYVLPWAPAPFCTSWPGGRDAPTARAVVACRGTRHGKSRHDEIHRDSHAVALLQLGVLGCEGASPAARVGHRGAPGAGSRIASARGAPRAICRPARRVGFASGSQRDRTRTVGTLAEDDRAHTTVASACAIQPEQDDLNRDIYQQRHDDGR
jgi:hypothetical protein